MVEIFEIFNAVNGATLGYRTSEKRAKETCERTPPYRDTKTGGMVVLDYLPALNGFYVLDMRDDVKGGRYLDRGNADKASDFENMASDVNSFRVVQWRN